MDCLVAFIHNHKLAQICHKGKRHGEHGAGTESSANKSVSLHLIHYSVCTVKTICNTQKQFFFIYFEHNALHIHIIINGQMLNATSDAKDCAFIDIYTGDTRDQAMVKCASLHRSVIINPRQQSA